MKKRLSCLFLVLCILNAIGTAALAAGTESIEAMNVSEAGIEFIEEFEGFSAYPYADASKWYIGYGTNCDKDEYPDGISEEEAQTLLRDTLRGFEASVNSFLAKNDITLTQYQFDALLSFTYNLGPGWMSGSNRICRYLIDGTDAYSDLEIVNAIGIWCHVSSEVNKLLVERRLAEAKLFLYDDYGDDDSTDYTYIVFDAGDGSVEDDIVFFECGEPYGTLQQAERNGYTFAGWHTGGGKQISSEDTAEENLTVFASWSDGAQSETDNLYSDVTENDWFYTYVSQLSKNRVIGGYPNGTFQPANSVTFGEALKLILLAAGYDEQEATDSHWASGYLELAVSRGLIDKKENTNLDAAVSRLIIAQIAAKALDLPQSQSNTPFSDTSDKYVLSLYDTGIIEGSSSNGVRVYKPASSISRCEISAIIWRINNTDTQATSVQTNKIQCGSKWLDILDGVQACSYDADSFYLDDGLMRYASDEVETRNGVDVSSYQGKIDWQKVKASGIDYAIIRLGYRGYTVGGINLDSSFKSNIQGALDAGLEVGVYFFSQAITDKEAVEEAEFVLSYIEEYDITYPVVFDWEPVSSNDARTYGLNTDTLCRCAGAFCDTIADAGYTPMVYFNTSMGYERYDLSMISEYDFWLAQYSDKPSFYYNYHMWQYSSKGTVDGISGTVDMNICFAEY